MRQIKKGRTLVAMTLALTASSVSLSALAQTAYERALGVGSDSVRYNDKNKNGQFEVYDGVWSTKELNNIENKKEFYNGVWRVKTEAERQQDIASNNKGYNIVGGSTGRSEDRMIEASGNNASQQASQEQHSQDDGHNHSHEMQPARSGGSSISIGGTSSSSVSNDARRSSAVVSRSSDGSFTERPSEQPAAINLPSVDSLIN